MLVEDWGGGSLVDRGVEKLRVEVHIVVNLRLKDLELSSISCGSDRSIVSFNESDNLLTKYGVIGHVARQRLVGEWIVTSKLSIRGVSRICRIIEFGGCRCSSCTSAKYASVNSSCSSDALNLSVDFQFSSIDDLLGSNKICPSITSLSRMRARSVSSWSDRIDSMLT